MSEDEKLSPETSPNTMEIKKKKARRINNWPLLIALIIIVLLASVIGWVMSDRTSSRGEWQAGERKPGGASNLAKEVAGERAGGIVLPKQESKPVLPSIPPPSPKREEPPIQAPAPVSRPATPPTMPQVARQDQPQAPPRPTEEENRMRQRQIQMIEASLASPILVNLDTKRLDAGGKVEDELNRIRAQIAAAGQVSSSTYEQQVAELTTPGGVRQRGQQGSRKELTMLNDLEQRSGNWRSGSMVQAPPSPYTILTGSIIPATLVDGVNSDIPGQIKAVVSRNVYDSPTGRFLLIPQGSELVGQYSSQVDFGQTRLFVYWERVNFPDGKYLDLGAMPSSTSEGYAGLHDRVNHHYGRLFGSALLMSGIIAGVDMSQNRNSNNNNNNNGNQQRMSDAISESLGQVFGNLLAEMFRRNLDISPTIIIRNGFPFNVTVVKDLVFTEPYKAFDWR